ncbi:MAG: hypothetical protein R2789_14385 [Microthrixaceae bacterium]
MTVTNPGAEAVTVDSPHRLDRERSGGGHHDSPEPRVKATTGRSWGHDRPGGSNQCSFTVEVSGDGVPVTDVVEVEASDNDGNDVSDTDDARVETDAAVPTVALTKSAASTRCPNRVRASPSRS